MNERKEMIINGEAVCSPKELCEMFPVFTQQNLFKMRENKEGPSYYKIGKRIYYSIQSTKDYIQASFINH